jgi:hypothetical protein
MEALLDQQETAPAVQSVVRLEARAGLRQLGTPSHLQRSVWRSISAAAFLSGVVAG